MGYQSTCWPGQDPLDGWNELPLDPEAMRAYWDADVLDEFGIKPRKIIKTTDPFLVRFRVELVGPLWRCMTGNWIFDIGFTSIGPGGMFDLSSLLPPGALDIIGWNGCERRGECVHKEYKVPANTIQVVNGVTMYELAATYRLTCCGDQVGAVGGEPLEEYEFYTP
jgi:hypothetical protein